MQEQRRDGDNWLYPDLGQSSCPIIGLGGGAEGGTVSPFLEANISFEPFSVQTKFFDIGHGLTSDLTVDNQPFDNGGLTYEAGPIWNGFCKGETGGLPLLGEDANPWSNGQPVDNGQTFNMEACPMIGWNEAADNTTFNFASTAERSMLTDYVAGNGYDFGTSAMNPLLGTGLNNLEWQPDFPIQSLEVDAYHPLNLFPLLSDLIPTPPPSVPGLLISSPSPSHNDEAQVQQTTSQPQPLPTLVPTTTFQCTQVPNCMKTFKRSSDLARHITNFHGINHALHLCPIPGCPRNQGVGYSRADKVTEHLWKKHAALGYLKRV